MGLLDQGSIGRYHDAMTGRTGAEAAREAARVQKQAYTEAMGEVGRGYDTAEGYYQPYVQPGLEAYQRMQEGSTAEGLGANLEALQASPAIMALINARANRVGNQLASTGLSRSGYGMRQLGNVDQESLLGLEGMLYGRSGNIAGMGYGAGERLAGLGVDRSNALSSLLLGRAGARASGILGRAQSLSQGAQNQYTAMHNAGSAVMGMFGGGMGGGGDLQTGNTTQSTTQYQSGGQQSQGQYTPYQGQGMMGSGYFQF